MTPEQRARSRLLAALRPVQAPPPTFRPFGLRELTALAAILALVALALLAL